MEIVLKRVQRDDDCTIGEMLIGGTHVCWVCEDPVRPEGEKIYGRTAIPAGRYRVRTTFSPRFQRPLPLLFDVPGFEGVRIHPGNTPDDTEGCLLPGLERREKGVGSSRLAFHEVSRWIDAAEHNKEEVWITIEEPDLDVKVPPQQG